MIYPEIKFRYRYQCLVEWYRSINCTQCWSGSVTFLYGSGSADSYYCFTDPDPALPSLNFKIPTKNKFIFITFWSYMYCTSVFIDKKSHKTVEIKVFLTLLLDDGKIQIRTNNEGSGRSKNLSASLVYPTSQDKKTQENFCSDRGPLLRPPIITRSSVLK